MDVTSSLVNFTNRLIRIQNYFIHKIHFSHHESITET